MCCGEGHQCLHPFLFVLMQLNLMSLKVFFKFDGSCVYVRGKSRSHWALILQLLETQIWFYLSRLFHLSQNTGMGKIGGSVLGLGLVFNFQKKYSWHKPESLTSVNCSSRLVSLTSVSDLLEKVLLSLRKCCRSHGLRRVGFEDQRWEAWLRTQTPSAASVRKS